MSARFAAFRHASYTRYFASRFFAGFATQIVSVAVGWQIYDLTQNPALLGWIGLVQFAPALLLVFVTGLASDRFGRRLVMALSVLLQTACATAIVALVLTGAFQPLPVLAIMTVFGVARAFLAPAASSLAVNLVPTEDFPNAVAWNSSAWQAASILGPVAGGLLYGLSPTAAYGTALTLFFIAAMLILAIPKPAQRKTTEPASWTLILGGFRYIWKSKIVLGAISLDLFAVLLGGAVALMPVYARDILELGPSGLGLLRAAPGIGALITILFITSFPIRQHAGALLFVFVGLFGAATALFGASTLAWLSIFALMLVGAFDMISVYIRETLVQLWTPDAVRGRVNAVNSIFVSASNELGEFRAGFMAAGFGAVFTVVSGGIAAIGITALWAVLFPALRRTQSLSDGHPDAAGEAKTAS